MGGTPSQVEVGGYPEYSLTRSGWGTPLGTWDRVPPRPGTGYPLGPGTGYPRDLGLGTPCPGPGTRYPPPQTWDWDWVPPPDLGLGTPWTWDWVPPRSGTGYPPRPGTGYPPRIRSGLDRAAQRVLATRRAVCLLRSRRRTFLLSEIDDKVAAPKNTS